MNEEESNFTIPEQSPQMGDVYVSFGDNGYKTTLDVLQKLPFDFSLLRTKRILVKPNAGRLVAPHLGINTSPEVVAGILDFLLERDIKNIFVGESCILGVKPLEALEKCGIAGEARQRNVEIVDLDAEKPKTVSIPRSKAIKNLKVCKKALEADFIISVPVMKTHMHTQVSLGLKNMKGCLYGREKVRLHQLPEIKNLPKPAKPLDMAIADLAKILFPDLCVIDGIIGQEGLGPSAGNPIELGAAVASFNSLAADIVTARLMGIDPAGINHLQLAIKEIWGQDSTLGNFQVFPEDYEKKAIRFEPPPEKISFEFKNVRVEDVDSCSACLSTALMFLKRYQENLADYFNEDNPLRIAIGKGIGPQKEGTLLIGNCTAHRRKGCVFVKGCPPVASDILRSLMEHKESKKDEK
ncbi:DUF362 domain-containing protein [Candidatus Sumerlaeota bacterium]|nr:DUF362 domain-containing protein [Candidatus Sumerlaeota bacterium]